VSKFLGSEHVFLATSKITVAHEVVLENRGKAPIVSFEWD